MTGPIRRLLTLLFGLTPAEEDDARAAAGKPWRTGYYIAGRDWPVQKPTGLTLDETYATLELIGKAER